MMHECRLQTKAEGRTRSRFGGLDPVRRDQTELTPVGDHRPTMTDPAEAIGLLVVVEFVAMAAILLLLVPLEVAAPVVPLLLFFVVVLHLYRS